MQEMRQVCEQGEALLLVVKVVLVVFLTYPNDNEDIEQRKANLVVKYCKSCIGCLLSMS